MNDLEGKTMIKNMKELENDYRALLEEYSNLPKNYPKLNTVLKIKGVLKELIYAGKYIYRPQYREKLSEWCRDLGRIVYNLIGDFPAMRIYPLDIKEALKATYENQNLNEKVEDMLWIASYLPMEKKQALIEDAYNIAATSTNEEDRSRSLRAISNYQIQDELLPDEKILMPHQIPSPPYDFTGRENDVEELLACFGKGVSIIGLRGIGGIGKKTLAFVLAERLKDRFPDGQLLVDLRGAGSEPLNPTDAMSQVIRSYRPNEKMPNNEAALANLYRSVLSGKRALLLLINVIDRKQITPLLPPANCSLIFTSRRKFVLPGMVTKDLDVLKLDDAVELLLKLASSRFSKEQILKKESWRELANLCGCLPLALRASGSHLVNTSDINLDSYIENLKDERTRLTRIGAEGVDIGVDAIFRLSVDRLGSETKQSFLNASVFPADFDDQAEENICQDEGHIHLSELVRWSLVDYLPQSSDYGRYKLHDLTRLFASTMQSDEFRAITQERHAAYYKDILSAAEGLYLQGRSGMLEGLALFDREEANIRAGQGWAETNLEANLLAAELCMSYPYVGAYVLDLRLHPQQKTAWLNMALLAAKLMKNKNMEGANLGNLGLAYAALGDARKAIEYYEQARAIAREIGDRRSEGNALGNLGSAFYALGDARKAIEYYEQALAIAREIGDRRGEGADLGNLGSAFYALGDARKAIDYYEQYLAITREIGDRRGEGADLGNLGGAYYALGDARKAIDYYEQSLAIDREIGDRRGEGNALGNLGNAYAALGNARKAIEYYEEALAISREIGDRRSEGNALGNLGLAYANLGGAGKAIEYYEQALAIAREIGDRRGEGADLGNLGLAYADLGDAHKAIDYYEQALAIAREIGDRRGEGADLGNLGGAYYALGDARKAIDYYEQYLAITREIGDRRGESSALGNLGLAYADLGDARKAIDYYEQALAIAREIGDRRGEGADLGNLGLACSALGDVRKAIEYYEQAFAISREIGDRRNEGVWLGNLGLAYAALGDARKAIDYYEQRLIIAREIGDRRGEKYACWNLGLEYENAGDLKRATEMMQICVDYEREIGHPDAEKDAKRMEALMAKSRNGHECLPTL